MSNVELKLTNEEFEEVTTEVKEALIDFVEGMTEEERKEPFGAVLLRHLGLAVSDMLEDIAEDDVKNSDRFAEVREPVDALVDLIRCLSEPCDDTTVDRIIGNGERVIRFSMEHRVETDD